MEIRLSLTDRIDTLRDGASPHRAYVTYSPPTENKIILSLIVAGLLIARALAQIGDYYSFLTYFPSFPFSQLGESNGCI